jgi:SAM-dependent methyltransferase
MRRMDTPGGLQPPESLKARYSSADLEVFTDKELSRFLGIGWRSVVRDPAAWDGILEALAWEFLYRVEPHLYERLISGEKLHPSIIEWLPNVGSAVEIGAGTGRWTLPLASKCERLIAVEPSAPLLEILQSKLAEMQVDQVKPIHGFFDELPLETASAELVTSCSAFTPHDSHGGDAGLKEMERVCSSGGMIVLVSPTETAWFIERGFRHVRFEGEMFVDYGTREEAHEICLIFYPWALDTLGSDGRISYEALQIKPPNDLVWKRS